MKNFDFTCRYCETPGSINVSDDGFVEAYDVLSKMSLTELSADDRMNVLAMRNIHAACFNEVLEDFKNAFHAGSYVSSVTFDEDDHRDVFVFQYVHKVMGDSCEIWTINCSPRYVRKGGEFLTKSIVNIEDAINYMFVGYSNTATPSDLRVAFNAYADQTRRQYLMDLIESETTSLMDSDSFLDYASILAIEGFQEVFEDIRIFEKNISSAEVLTI